MSLSGLYQIANLANGKRYVGSARDIAARWRRHRSDLRRGCHPNSHLQAAWHKYGEVSFGFFLLARLERAELRATESRLLARIVGSRECYNIGTRADAPMEGRRHRPESKEKVRRAKLGTHLSSEAKARIGRATTRRSQLPEVRLVLSRANRGRSPSAHTRAKIGAFFRGRPLSSAHRAKIGEANRRRKLSVETRAKIGAANRGRKFSPEHLAKLGAAAKGRRLSPEHRAKIGAGQSAYQSKLRALRGKHPRITFPELRQFWNRGDPR